MSTKAYPNLKNLNFYVKLIVIILFLLSIIFVNNTYLILSLITIFIITSFLLKHYKALQMSIMLIIVFMFYYLHPFLLIVVKTLLLYILYLIVKDLVNIKERKYLFDKVFYRFKGNINKLYVGSNYKNRVFLNNMNVYNDMDKFTRRKYSEYLVKQALMKTSYDMQDISYRNTLSYYKYSNKKGSILNMKWGSMDNTCLLISILLFVLVLFYR